MGGKRRKEAQKEFLTPGTDVLISFTVRDVGYEGHDKWWTDVRGSPAQEGQGGSPAQEGQGGLLRKGRGA